MSLLENYSIYQSTKYNNNQPKPPFHGDLNMIKIILDIITNLNIFVETGTYMGKTTYFMGKNFPYLNCYTCEVNKNYFDISNEQLKDLNNVVNKLDKSPNFLYTLENYDKNIYKKKCLFWLDAHWGSEPIYEELNFITNNFNTFIIFVDDFMIPYDEGFTNDGYNISKIKNSINSKESLHFYMPNYSSQDEYCKTNPVGYVIISSIVLNNSYLKNVSNLFN